MVLQFNGIIKHKANNTWAARFQGGRSRRTQLNMNMHYHVTKLSKEMLRVYWWYVVSGNGTELGYSLKG